MQEAEGAEGLDDLGLGGGVDLAEGEGGGDTDMEEEEEEEERGGFELSEETLRRLSEKGGLPNISPSQCFSVLTAGDVLLHSEAIDFRAVLIALLLGPRTEMRSTFAGLSVLCGFELLVSRVLFVL